MPTLVALTLSSLNERAMCQFVYTLRPIVLGAERRPAPRHRFRGECCAPAPRIEFTVNRVCRPTGQSSDSESARDQWQCIAVTPQVNLRFSFVALIKYVSKHLVECIAIGHRELTHILLTLLLFILRYNFA